jgi:hypothetical protein
VTLLRPISVVAFLSVSLAGATAGAFPGIAPTCDEEISFEPSLTPPAHDVAQEPVEPAPVAHTGVVPCAMIESGLLGPACEDAAFYVVTQAGVLLCSVDLDTLAVQQSATPVVERAPAPAAATFGGGLAANALVPEAAAVPPCFVRDLPVGALEARAVALDRGDKPPVPPA